MSKRSRGRPRLDPESETKQVLIQAPEDLVARVDAKAKAWGLNRSEATRDAWALWLEAEGEPD